MIDAPAPNAVGRGRIEQLKAKFRELDKELELLQDTFAVAGGREFALARTHLEEASMWTTKALCRKYPGGQS